MPYQYDVAYSFMAQDEAIAAELDELLRGRISTFLYSKRQENIAGTDGEKSFNAVFSEQARLVVVLYRTGWGGTPWTRIEETAIRNRAYEEGYDFVIFIPLDSPPTVPRWLPRTRLWIGLNRWGVSGAASAIESRIQELGGEPHEESVIDKAARIEAQIKFLETRTKFLRSIEGVAAASALFSQLKDAIKDEIEQVNLASPTFGFTAKYQAGKFIIIGRGPGLSVQWTYHYANSLQDAFLNVALWNGHPPWSGLSDIGQNHQHELERKQFEFDIKPDGNHCWKSTVTPNPSYSSKELASQLLIYCLEKIETRGL